MGRPASMEPGTAVAESKTECAEFATILRASPGLLVSSIKSTWMRNAKLDLRSRRTPVSWRMGCLICFLQFGFHEPNDTE